MADIGNTREAAGTGLLSLFRGGYQDLVTKPAGNVGVLDVLRTAAIVLVFSTHSAEQFNAAPKIAKFPLFLYGWSGVDLFFVLSGLLIGTQLWRELSTTGEIKIGRFLLRRGLRIWPLYFGFMVFLGAQILFAHHPSKGSWADVFFLSNYVPGQFLNGWSLSTEEQFYIFAPLLLMGLATVKMHARSLWIFPVVALFSLPISRVITIHGSLVENMRVDWRTLYFPAHTHSDGLAIGLLLAYGVIFRPELMASLRFRVVTASLMIFAGVGLYAVSHVVFNFTALALFFGAATLLGTKIKGTSRIWNWWGFYLISRLSYGIYLNHALILHKFAASTENWRSQHGQFGFWMCYLVSFLLSMGIAAVTFHLIEWPFLNLRARWQKSMSREKPSLITAPSVPSPNQNLATLRVS